MDTSAPLLRAKDEEIARLRADKAELLEALKYVGGILGGDSKVMRSDGLWSAYSRVISVVSKQHG